MPKSAADGRTTVECAAELRSQNGGVVVLAEDVAEAMKTDDGKVKRVEELRARTSEGGMFADDTAGAQ